MQRFFVLLLAAAMLTACLGQSPAPASSVSESSASAVSSSAPAPTSEPAPAPVPEPPKPDNSWKLDTPEKHQMDAGLLAQMHIALENAPVYAVVTAKDGVIVDEYYQAGYDETSLFELHSCSKSFTSALVGIAIAEGKIGGVDDLLSQYLPQVLELEDARKHTLTLRHLLTHTSGLEWYEWGGSNSNWREFRSSDNWVSYILGRRLVTEPGARFNYSTGNTHLLAAALESAVGMDTLEYGREKLFAPLGMDSVQWGTDPQGVADGGNGVSITARDAARFGQLFLDKGVWHHQQLITTDWLEQSTSVQNAGPGDSTGQYGYQWWVRSFGGYHTYYAFGAWGQYIFLVPELNLVTVIASSGPQNSYASRPYFTDYVLAACSIRSKESE